MKPSVTIKIRLQLILDKIFMQSKTVLFVVPKYHSLGRVIASLDTRPSALTCQ